MQNPIHGLFSSARYPHPYSMFHDMPSTHGGSCDETGFPNAGAPAMPKPPGEKRVFFLGNSAVRHTPDAAVPPPPGLLELAFKDAGHSGVKVYNYGIESGNCGQSLMLALDQLVDLAPDVLVVYDCATDICVPLLYDPRPGYPFNTYLLELIHNAVGSSTLETLDLLKVEGDRRQFLRGLCDYGTDAWREALAQAYVRFIRKFMALGSAFNFKVVHIIQPIYNKAEPAEGEAHIAAQTTFLEHAYDVLERTRQAIRGVESEYPDRAKFRCHDFSKLFFDNPAHCFGDYVHTTAAANQYVAGKIFELIHDMVIE